MDVPKHTSRIKRVSSLPIRFKFPPRLLSTCGASLLLLTARRIKDCLMWMFDGDLIGKEASKTFISSRFLCSRSHSGEYMFEILQTFLLAVFGTPWTYKCICVSSDGAANMRGNTRGLVTRMADACVEGMGRVWCGLHQLDLVMQRAFTDALVEMFCGNLV